MQTLSHILVKPRAGVKFEVTISLHSEGCAKEQTPHATRHTLKYGNTVKVESGFVIQCTTHQWSQGSQILY